ncbi:response regulator transcription factor [Candidatus Omnitrophota bacterium]
MKRILICEDERDSKEAITNILSKRDYEVYAAADGRESLEKTRDLNPDLVLLDIRMPEINGIEVAKEIRKFNTRTRIIFITAFQSPQLVKEAAKYDISDYIAKPAPAEDILKSIQDALKT